MREIVGGRFLWREALRMQRLKEAVWLDPGPTMRDSDNRWSMGGFARSGGPLSVVLISRYAVVHWLAVCASVRFCDRVPALWLIMASSNSQRSLLRRRRRALADSEDEAVHIGFFGVSQGVGLL